MSGYYEKGVHLHTDRPLCVCASHRIAPPTRSPFSFLLAHFNWYNVHHLLLHDDDLMQLLVFCLVPLWHRLCQPSSTYSVVCSDKWFVFCRLTLCYGPWIEDINKFKLNKNTYLPKPPPRDADKHPLALFNYIHIDWWLVCLQVTSYAYISVAII